ncbi:MAG: class I SAM-dependent RNA methyltransferase [Candidatus Marinimicrobia bacterium]|nr:class I SAM-dependent RNA methyltransferase [Candidatus Neomarinimicrobiota bacterium]MBT6870794.1 class I SAM-dependent RNA methyltransferase [Candidatus Neomarinimicrobiota bacterium]
MRYNLYLTCPRGLEIECANELEEMGCENITIDSGGVFLTGDLRTIYTVNHLSRLGMHLLLKIVQLDCKDERTLYHEINGINWTKYISYIQTISVNFRARRSWVTNTQFAALKVKDAVVDKIRAYSGKRPSIDIRSADVPIDVFLDGTTCNVYLNTSGDALFKRGYREKIHKAAINEALAAGLVKLTKWSSPDPLFDPMCGSGTFAIEAAMMALKIPPRATRRDYSFMKWLNYDSYLWEDVKLEAENNINFSSKMKIYSSDKLIENIDMCRASAIKAGVDKYIQFSVCNIKHFRPLTEKSGFIITNPPYGERIGGDDEELEFLYTTINERFNNFCKGFSVFMICTESPFLEYIEATPSSSIPIRNGKLECNFIEYNIPSAEIRSPNA